MPERFRRAWVPLLYLTASFVVFAPVWLNLDSRVVGQDDIDSGAIIWLYAWWPHALLDGTNPLITDALFVPEGFNLAWSPAHAGPAILLAPVTLAFGAQVAFNLAMLLSPPLAAWAAYALCRHLTGSLWPSVAGGWLFGFSPVVMGAMLGSAPNFSLVALLPVMVLLVVKRMQGELSQRRFVAFMAPLVAAQVLIGSEILAVATVFGGIALIIAAAVLPDQRRALAGVVGLLAASLALGALLVAPLLLTMLQPHVSPEHADPRAFVTDLFALFVPGDLQLGGAARGRWWDSLGVGHRSTGSGFLGLPLIAIGVAFAVAEWRHRRARVVALCAAVFVVASLGPELVAGGRARGVPLPWEPFVHLPLVRYALPLRFTVFAFLALSVLLAMWLSRRPTRARWALALLALAVLVPAVGSPVLSAKADDPPFFRTDAWKSQLRPGDNVMTVPTYGRGSRWAARTDIGFRMAGGYVGALPSSYTRYRAFGELSPLPKRQPLTEAELRRFVAAKDVTVVLLEPGQNLGLERMLVRMGARPQTSGGISVYRLRGGSSASETGTGP